MEYGVLLPTGEGLKGADGYLFEGGEVAGE